MSDQKNPLEEVFKLLKNLQDLNFSPEEQKRLDAKVDFALSFEAFLQAEIKVLIAKFGENKLETPAFLEMLCTTVIAWMFTPLTKMTNTEEERLGAAAEVYSIIEKSFNSVAQNFVYGPPSAVEKKAKEMLAKYVSNEKERH